MKVATLKVGNQVATDSTVVATWVIDAYPRPQFALDARCAGEAFIILQAAEAAVYYVDEDVEIAVSHFFFT